MARNEQELDLLIEYFKSLREEIHLRIREHTRLVWIKIVSLGAIISFVAPFVGRYYPGEEGLGSTLLYFVWIIPLAAIIFDMLIAGNLRVIYNLGPYIRDHFEKRAFREYVSKTDFKFWEECAASASPKYTCYSEPDMVAVWLFTFGSVIFAAVLRYLVGFVFPLDYILIALFLISSTFALWYLVRSIRMKREFLYPEIGNVPKIKWVKRPVKVGKE